MSVQGFATISSLALVSILALGSARSDERPMTRVTQVKDSSCMCRGNGTAYDEGQVTCLRTVEGPRLATCGMVLNNMSWKFSDRPCPNS